MILAKPQYFFYASKNGTDREKISSGVFSNIPANPINEVLHSCKNCDYQCKNIKLKTI